MGSGCLMPSQDQRQRRASPKYLKIMRIKMRLQLGGVFCHGKVAQCGELLLAALLGFVSRFSDSPKLAF